MPLPTTASDLDLLLRNLRDLEPGTVKPAMLITVVVQDTKRRTLSRTMRRTDKLQDLMDYYYHVLSSAVSYGEGRFLFDGTRVNGQKTPRTTTW
jgi:small ubiquitin-related modifier